MTTWCIVRFHSIGSDRSMCGPLGREGCFPNGQISTEVLRFQSYDTADEFRRQHFEDFGAADHEVMRLDSITFTVTVYHYYDGRSKVVFRGSYDEAVMAYFMWRGRHADEIPRVKVTLDVETDLSVALEERGHLLQIAEQQTL
jgi:hypothetical protein